jgi:hypothetical protein
MLVNWPAFVLQRRINVPLPAAERVLCDPRLLAGATVVELGPEGPRLQLDTRFVLTFPPFGLEGTSWRAEATVCSRRGRRLVALELEANPWDSSSTELLVRPRARRLGHWTARRVQRYFRCAHLAADALVRMIDAHAGAPASTTSRVLVHSTACERGQRSE